MSQNLASSDRFWNKRIKLPYVIILVLLSGLTLALGQYSLFNFHRNNPPPVIVQSDNCPPPTVLRYRMNDYQFAHPLLLSDRMEESKDMMGLKNEIALMIRQKKDAGQITSASVYIRNLNDNTWISINPDEGFNPGSLIKVPIMMTYLHEAEKKPGLLEKKLILKPSDKVPRQTFAGDRIEVGKPYTIKQLLYYMIAKSDNYATFLLNNNVNIPEFQKLFTDVGMPQPDVQSRDFRITASDYSKFFRMLYNATYVNNEHADFALSLLIQGDFTEGMLKYLPSGTKVAHKFGEWGDPNNPTNHQLSESGIIFDNDNPMLITVMTRGNQVSSLPPVISEISRRVFDRITVEKPKS